MNYIYFINKFLKESKYTWNILPNYFLNYFCIKLDTLEVTFSKSVPKGYFIVRVYPEVYLKYTSISTRQNACKGYIHNLWSNGLVIRGQVYQTRIFQFFWKWLKNCISLLSFEAQSNEYQRFLGTWWLKDLTVIH